MAAKVVVDYDNISLALICLGSKEFSQSNGYQSDPPTVASCKHRWCYRKCNEITRRVSKVLTVAPEYHEGNSCILALQHSVPDNCILISFILACWTTFITNRASSELTLWKVYISEASIAERRNIPLFQSDIGQKSVAQGMSQAQGNSFRRKLAVQRFWKCQ